MVEPGEQIVATSRRVAKLFLHAGKPNYRWETDFPPLKRKPELAKTEAPAARAPRKRKRSKK